MTGAAAGASRLRVGLAAGLLCVLAPGAAAAPLGDAVALYKKGRLAEARAILEPLVAAEPQNAAALYYLGMVLERSGGTASLDGSRQMLGRAVQLSPQNATYLAEYAGVCLELADRDSSLGLALEGRDAMIRALAANPRDMEAREALMEFYAKAPWPIGDSGKAMEQAAEIAKRDAKRGAAAYRDIAGIFEKAGRADLALSAEREAQRLAPGKAQ
jgi:tetratricopeptide (TPR) repeat protein